MVRFSLDANKERSSAGASVGKGKGGGGEWEGWDCFEGKNLLSAVGSVCISAIVPRGTLRALRFSYN